MINQSHTYFAGKRILVTGASGYLATNLINSLKDVKCTIIRLSRSNKLLPVNGIVNIVDITGNICARETFEQILKDVDIVYHLAAQTSVYVAEENPLLDLEVNVVPMLNLLETCRNKAWKPIIIFSGTVTEVGIPKNLPVSEVCEDYPVTIYDIHKLMAERYLKYYSQHGIVYGTVLRLANVYGPGPKSSNADRGILNMMIRKALKGEDLPLYGKGEYLRDYIYIKDAVRAFLIAGMKIDNLKGQHYIIGSGEGHILKEAFGLVADRVKRKVGVGVQIVNVNSPDSQNQIDSRNFVSDSGKFIAGTDWKPMTNLINGIDQTIEYLWKK